MASRRMIHPSFWQSESVVALPFTTRLLFIGLFSNADDQGRMRAHPALIRSTVFPYDDLPVADIAQWLDTLSRGGFILLYQVDGIDYLQVVNWWRYQQPSFAWPSKMPAPDGWADRVKYRQGNAVVEENWNQPEAVADSPSAPSEPTVTSERPHSDVTLTSAPSISISGNDSISGNGSKNIDAADGAPSAPTFPSTFDGWLERVENPPQGSNRTAQLVALYSHLWPNRAAPDFGRVGRFAKRVGGAGRACQLLWQTATARPAGDPLDYAEATAKGKKPVDDDATRRAAYQRQAEQNPEPETPDDGPEDWEPWADIRAGLRGRMDVQTFNKIFKDSTARRRGGDGLTVLVPAGAIPWLPRFMPLVQDAISQVLPDANVSYEGQLEAAR